MTPASIHTSSNPGTAHPPIDRAKVPSMDEWLGRHRKRGLIERINWSVMAGLCAGRFLLGFVRGLIEGRRNDCYC